MRPDTGLPKHVTGGNVENEVAVAYDGWGKVSTSWQAHAGAATTTGESQSPKVQYAYEDGQAGGEAKYVRLDYVTYPSSREVYYNYSSTGVGGVLSRLDNIANNGDGTTKYAQYATWLGAGTILKVTHPAINNGLELNYGTGGTYGGFDRFGRIIDQKWQNTATTVKDRYTYGYDYNSNRLYRKNEHASGGAFSELYHANGATIAAAYDGLNRLTDFRRGTLSQTNRANDTISSNISRVQDFGLEALGNWKTFKDDADGSGWDLDQAREHNKANEIDTDNTHGDADNPITGTPNWVDPIHDAAGNMTTMPQPNAPTSSYTCKYDAWNRLVETKAGENVVATYSYDGKHRRIRKVVEGSPDVTYDYYYNTGWQILEIRKDSDTDPYEQYVWGIRYVHSPVCRFRDGNTDGDYADTGDNTDDNLYFTNDANFNVTALIDPSSGNPVERYVYDAYGKVTIYNSDWSQTITWANSKKNIVLYTGHKFDHETGLFQAGHRYYHPTMGRFISIDPIKDGMNWYEYVKSSPVIKRDTLGLACCEECR